MKKIYLFAAMAMTAMQMQAQDVAATLDTYAGAALATEDLSGTARYIGMGGAMDALGADISTIGTNPAGIGLFRKNQFCPDGNTAFCKVYRWSPDDLLVLFFYLRLF